MIENKDYFTYKIMGESRHQFIYGYNGKERETFLKGVALKYPIVLDKSSPIGIYISDPGLPKLSKEHKDLDELELQVIYRDYVNCLIASNILKTAIEQIDEKLLIERSKEFLDRLNKLFVNNITITSLVDFKNILEETKELYYDEYVKYTSIGELHRFNRKIQVMIMMEAFIRYFKRMVNTNSYLGIIIDQQEPLARGIQEAINNFVGARINSDMSMKVSCEPEEWKTYYNPNGVLVEDTHDYGDVQLDSCYQDYTKKMKKKWQIN